MIFTLNNLENIISTFANGNYFVQTYKYGNFLNAISEKKLKYPILVTDFRGGNLTRINTSIAIITTVADRVLSDESNLLEVYSDRLQVVRDLYTTLNQHKDKFEITAATYEPFLEKSGDMLAGYVATININILDATCPNQLPTP